MCLDRAQYGQGPALRLEGMSTSGTCGLGGCQRLEPRQSAVRIGVSATRREASLGPSSAGGSSWASVMDMANLVKSMMRAGTSGGLPRHNDDLQTTLGDAHPANHFDGLRGTGPEGAPILESTLQFDLGADGVCVDSSIKELCDPNNTPTWLTSTGRDSEYPAGTNYLTGTLFVGKNAHARQFWHHGGGGPGLTAFLIYSPATPTEESVGVVVAGNNRNPDFPGMAAYILRQITEADPPSSYPRAPRPGGWVADEAASVLNEGPAYAGGSPVCH